MKKSTKGAVAAGAAAVLLLGGAGSLAYWNDTETIPGGAIEAGTLTLTPSGDAAAWTLNGTTVAGNDLSSVLVVPGDTLRYTGTWTVGATGDNLEAEVGFSGLEAAASVQGKMTVTPTYTLEGATLPAGTEVTEDNDGDVISATVVVDFPFGDPAGPADNASQGMTLDLTAGAITLTQTDATPPTP